MISEPDDRKVEVPSKPGSTIRRVMFWIAVGWFCCFYFLFVLIIALETHFSEKHEPSGWSVLFLVAGGLLWIGSAYWIYDKLFRMAQARWPEAKGIRAILSALLKSFLLHHD